MKNDTRTSQNKYINKDNNVLMNLKLYECPIFSTHNTFFEGNNFIDNTYIKITKLCEFFPVCIEIDFKPVDLKKTLKKSRNRSNSVSSVNSNNNISKTLEELEKLSKSNQQEYGDVFIIDKDEVPFQKYYTIQKETQVGGTSSNVPECIQCGIGHGPLSKDHTKIKYDDQFKYLNNIIETYKNINNNNKYPLIITFDIEKVLSGKGLRSIFGSRSGSISSVNSITNNDIKVKKIKETTRCLQNVSKYCEIIHKNFYGNKENIGENYKDRNLSDCMNKIIVRLKDNHFEHIRNLNIPYIMNEGSYGFDSQIKNNDYKNIIRVYPKSFDHNKQEDISKNIVTATINMFEQKEEKYTNVNMMAFNYQDIDNDKLELITKKFTDFYKSSTTFFGGKPKTKKKKRNSSNKKKSVKKQKK